MYGMLTFIIVWKFAQVFVVARYHKKKKKKLPVMKKKKQHEFQK